MRRERSSSAGFAEGDLRLHIAIAEASNNLFMRSMGGVIQAALRASFLISAPISERERDITIEAHVRIVNAIKNRNPEAASAEMANVIVNGIKRLQDSVATPQGKRRTVGGLNGVRKRVQRMDQT